MNKLALTILVRFPQMRSGRGVYPICYRAQLAPSFGKLGGKKKIRTDQKRKKTRKKFMKIQSMKIRSEADEHWQLLLNDAEAFAMEHDIQPVCPGKRVRTTKRMPGELARDEKVGEVSENFKVTVYIRAIDSILTQLQERFSEDTICFLKEMQLLTPASLSSRTNFSSNDIHRLCAYYDIDSSVVCRELNEFSMVFIVRYKT
jgi:hypothetical protein